MCMRFKRLRGRLTPLVFITIGLATVLSVLVVLQFSRPIPEVLIAKKDIAQGATLTITDFEVASIDLGSAQDSYVLVNEFPEGASLAKSISEGEVLAKSQSAEFGPRGFTVIRFMPELPVAKSLKIGDRVGVWVVSGEQFEDLQPAEQIAAGRLMSIEENEGLFADEQPYVEITVPEITLPEVLKSMAADDRVFLVEPAL